MVIVAITQDLDKELKKRLDKNTYYKIKDLFMSLKKDPYKGDVLHVLGNVILKEIKFKTFRFYFLTSNNLIKFVACNNLEKELIKFIRMSKKNDQQHVINDILNKLKKDKDHF
ncbi:MAG: hypothetical protein ACMXYF_02415 [Candidatus Woesearchaeota archaeon]